MFSEEVFYDKVRIMMCPMKAIRLLCLSMLAVASATLLPSDVVAGQKPASPPRAASIVSPDGELRAEVLFPGDENSMATGINDESRVIVRCNSQSCEPAQRVIRLQDYSSASGINGYFVSRGKWSPDSQFFVYSFTSSGGHSPWRHPIGVYSRADNQFTTVDNLIGSPIVSEEFEFIGPHTLTIRTPGDDVLSPGRPTPIDLEEASEKLQQLRSRPHGGWPVRVSPLDIKRDQGNPP